MGAEHEAIAESVNAAINYTMYSVFRVEPGVRIPQPTVPDGVVTRGWYDLTGFRADADLLVWTHAGDPQALQSAHRALLQAGDGRIRAVWSAVGVHRAAEFNRGHVPAFLAGEPPRDWVCVYPFVRTPEWYLLPEDERRGMLHEHGHAARDFADVRANTVASFGLGDYEWLLAFEADELVRIVDLIRELRATGARRFVQVEIPFFTGRRVEPADFLAQSA